MILQKYVPLTDLADPNAPIQLKTQVLHYVLYAFTFFAGLQSIMSKRKFIRSLIGNGKKFIDDSSRFL
jgi:hypothetical protein